MSQKKFKRAAKARNRGIGLPLLLALGGVILITAAFFALRGNGSPNPTVPVEVKGQPKLKVDRQVVDFGDVKLGQWVEASFVITNVGDEPLRFTEKPYITVAEGC